MFLAYNFLTVHLNTKNDYTSTFAKKNTESSCIVKLPNPPTIKNIKAILSGVFFIMLAILKRKWGSATSTIYALCENEADARVLSTNQNAGLQCKINSANQGVVEWEIVNFA